MEAHQRTRSRLEVLLTPPPAPPHGVTTIRSGRDVALCWDYDFGADPRVAALQVRARRPAWQVDDLAWDDEPQAVITPVARDLSRVTSRSPFAALDAAGWERFDLANFRYALSQLLHGEQLAVICAGAVIEVAPNLDAKAFAATQVLDEIRHTEAISRYLHERLDGPAPVNEHMNALFADVVTSKSWDMVYLGMQVMVEGMGLATLGALDEQTSDPLLRTMLRYVMRDEARHVAFGVLALRDVLTEMSAAEIRERQSFVLEATHALRDRLVPVAVLEAFELPVREATRLLLLSPGHRRREARLFRHIVPICSRLGLLDANDGWLRSEMARLGLCDPTDGAISPDVAGNAPDNDVDELTGPDDEALADALEDLTLGPT